MKVLLIFTLLFLGCSSYNFISHNDCNLYIINDSLKIEINKNHDLYIRWENENGIFSTRAKIDEKIEAITVNIVDIENDYLIVKSDYWDDLTELPINYYKGSNTKWVHTNDYNFLYIPLNYINRIGFYQQKPFSFADASLLHIGISTIVGSALALLIPSEKYDEEGNEYVNPSPGEKAIYGASIGFLGASVVEPIFIYYKKNPKIGRKIFKNIKSYEISDNNSNRLINKCID